VKRQCIHTLLPLDGVNANHRCFAGEFDRPDNRIELRNIEIMLELIARFPFFNEQKRFSFIKGPRDNQAPPVSAQELIQVFAAMLFAPGLTPRSPLRKQSKLISFSRGRQRRQQFR
jgi:hypothetical protein